MTDSLSIFDLSSFATFNSKNILPIDFQLDSIVKQTLFANKQKNIMIFENRNKKAIKLFHTSTDEKKQLGSKSLAIFV